MKQTYDWQTSTVARCARAVYFSIVGDCGCGKTLAAIKIALAKMMPVIVIAPTRRLCEQWKEAILEDAGPDEQVWVYSNPQEMAQGETYREDFEKWLAS